LIPPAAGAAALAAFVANCFTEALLPVEFFAVCFVLEYWAHQDYVMMNVARCFIFSCVLGE
jgi:amino acid permease